MTRCPICNSEAEEIDRDIFEGVGYDCKFHGRFRVSGTVTLPLISSELL